MSQGGLAHPRSPQHYPWLLMKPQAMEQDVCLSCKAHTSSDVVTGWHGRAAGTQEDVKVGRGGNAWSFPRGPLPWQKAPGVSLENCKAPGSGGVACVSCEMLLEVKTGLPGGVGGL